MIETPYPKRRQNIRVIEQDSQDGKVYILNAEDIDQYYRFREIEFSIFHLLDGETPLPTVKEKIEAQFNIELAFPQLETFVEDLKRKGLLEGVKSQAQKGKFWQNLFYARFKAFNPDRLLNALTPHFHFVFTKEFVAGASFLIAWSLFYSVANRTVWFNQTRALFHGWGLLILYLSLFSIGFVHEMGHALTCKYFGGRVKEMGFMLIYFQPGFYANVSDAYLFHEKKHKAFVGAAGLFFQFTFSALAIIALTLTIPGTFFASFLTGMIAVSGFTAFWNLNPLIKLDGYYILSDLLEVTNLRAHSFQCLWLMIQKKLFNLPETKAKIEAIPLRLRKIYPWYGILGIAYTSFFLSAVLLFLAKFVIRKLSGIGVLMIAGGITWGLWNWYKYAWPRLSSFFRKIEEDAELRLIVHSRLQKFSLILIPFIVLLLIPTRWGIKGACEVHPAIRRALAPLERGIVLHVNKQVGDSIGANEVFALLDDFEIRRELETLKAQKEVKEHRLALLKADYGGSLTKAEGTLDQSKLALEAHELLSPHKISEAKNAMEAAKSRVLKAQANRRTAENEWKRYQVLAKEELVSPKEAEEKKSAYEAAYQEYLAAGEDHSASIQAYHRISKELNLTLPKKLREEVTISKNNLMYTKDKSAEIRVAQSELLEVKTRILTDEQKLSRMKIRSPVDAVVMTPRVKELEGKIVGEGQPIAWVYQPGPMIFEIRVDELDISEIPRENEGENVLIKILALPNQSFKGKVTRIVPENLTNSGSKSFLVDVSVNDEHGVLLPGMQGTGKIYGKSRPVLWQALRRSVKFVFWKLWSLF